MVSVNGHESNGGGLAGGRREEGQRVPMAEVENAKEGELKAGEFGREELSGEAGAEDWTPFPRRSKAASMVGMEMS